MLDLMEIYNPWKKNPNWRQEGIKRFIFEKVYQSLSSPAITVIKGTRQCGKTFLIKQIISQLLAQGVLPDSIDYFLFDDPDLARYVESNLTAFANYLKGEAKNKKVYYVFLDEFQKVKDLTNVIKVFFEGETSIKFIISGSSSLLISEKVSESLYGRTQTFLLYPFSFQEFASAKIRESQFTALTAEIQSKLNLFTEDPAKSFKILKEIYLSYQLVIDKLVSPLFLNYALVGGYPKASLSETEKEAFLYLKEIKQAYLEKDIVNLLKIESLKEFENLISLLSLQAGGLTNYSSLQVKVGIAFQTLKKFLNILESTYLITRLSPYFSSKITSLKKMPKIFFNDVGLRNFFAATFTPKEAEKEIGAIAEGLVYSQLLKELTWKLDGLGKIYFWRSPDGNEIDFILKLGKELIPLEVKFQKEVKLGRGIKEFLKREELRHIIILTRDYFDQKELDNIIFSYLPLHLFALTTA